MIRGRQTVQLGSVLPKATMPLTVGGGRGPVHRVLLPLAAAAVFLLSVGVAAVPEEKPAVQEQPAPEVRAPTSLAIIKLCVTVDRKMFVFVFIYILTAAAS